VRRLDVAFTKNMDDAKRRRESGVKPPHSKIAVISASRH